MRTIDGKEGGAPKNMHRDTVLHSPRYPVMTVTLRQNIRVWQRAVPVLSTRDRLLLLRVGVTRRGEVDLGRLCSPRNMPYRVGKTREAWQIPKDVRIVIDLHHWIA